MSETPSYDTYKDAVKKYHLLQKQEETLENLQNQLEFVRIQEEFLLNRTEKVVFTNSREYLKDAEIKTGSAITNMYRNKKALQQRIQLYASDADFTDIPDVLEKVLPSEIDEIKKDIEKLRTPVKKEAKVVGKLDPERLTPIDRRGGASEKLIEQVSTPIIERTDIPESAERNEYEVDEEAPTYGSGAFRLVQASAPDLAEGDHNSPYYLQKISSKKIGDLSMNELNEFKKMLGQIPVEQQLTSIEYIQPRDDRSHPFFPSSFDNRVRSEYYQPENVFWKRNYDADMDNHRYNYDPRAVPNTKNLTIKDNSIHPLTNTWVDPRMEIKGSWLNNDSIDYWQSSESDMLKREYLKKQDHATRMAYYLREAN